jgi:hypothetical protein
VLSEFFAASGKESLLLQPFECMPLYKLPFQTSSRMRVQFCIMSFAQLSLCVELGLRAARAPSAGSVCSTVLVGWPGASSFFLLCRFGVGWRGACRPLALCLSGGGFLFVLGLWVFFSHRSAFELCVVFVYHTCKLSCFLNVSKSAVVSV